MLVWPRHAATVPPDARHIIAATDGRATRHRVNSLWTKHLDDDEANKLRASAVEALIGIKPQDEIEGMIGAQLIACHNASMECYRRAMLPDIPFDRRHGNLNSASKLSRTYATLLESLNRHREKGQQKVTVEHVHVHEGGQAIVGNVEAGGMATKAKEQPHAKQSLGLVDPRAFNRKDADTARRSRLECQRALPEQA